MKQGKSTIFWLTIFFVLSEILFFVLVSRNFTEFFDFFSKTFLVLLFIWLFTKKLTWARWTLSVLLTLLGMIYLTEGVYEGTASLYLIGSFDIFFGVIIHTSKSLEVYRTKIKSKDKAPFALNVSYDEKILDTDYPPLIKRYKALLVDGLLILAFLVVLMVIVQDNKYRPTIMITTGAILLLCYEPLLTVYSGTIGQKLMKIKVRRFGQPDRRLNLMNSYIRWLTKGVLGWVSFLTISFNKEHRAIHDFASDSIMLEENEKTAPNNEHVP